MKNLPSPVSCWIFLPGKLPSVDLSVDPSVPERNPVVNIPAFRAKRWQAALVVSLCLTDAFQMKPLSLHCPLLFQQRLMLGKAEGGFALFYLFPGTEYHSAAQGGSELSVFLPLLPKCLDFRCTAHPWLRRQLLELRQGPDFLSQPPLHLQKMA